MITHIRRMLGIAHYLALMFFSLLALTLIWGVPPTLYLIYCSVLGVLYFLVTAWAWRKDSDTLLALSLVTLVAAISFINSLFLSSDSIFSAMQGWLVIFGVFSLLLLLARNRLSEMLEKSIHFRENRDKEEA